MINYFQKNISRYVRQIFNLSLPHESVLRLWCSRVDGSPGFTEQAFCQLKLKVEDQKKKKREVIVEVVMDEMAIHKKVEFTGGRFVGCSDLGNGSTPDDTSPPASEALVFMAVAVNSSWKIPVAYFLINSITGEEKAKLVNTCANKLRDIDVHVTGLTSDAPASNISMMSNLGATINPESPDPTFFPSDYDDEPINIVFDACHMIKLVRNTFADFKVLKNSAGHDIKWEYIESLHKLQSEEGVHAANKLRKNHIEFRKQKMKVSLATQTLSKSVADAIQFCRQELKLPTFQGSEATEQFIRIFDELFDVMNSKNIFGRNSKSPMRTENENQWSLVFQNSKEYILGLSLLDGTKVIKSRRKTGFVGFLVNIQSLQNIFDQYVRTGRLNYLLTYKFSQDHLELFFGCIRSRLGSNNNPTPKQFEATYKRLLIHGVLEGLHGNCFPQDDTSILNVDISKCQDSRNDQSIYNTRRQYDLVDAEWDHDYVTSLTHISELSSFQESVTEYIGGFVVRQLVKKLACDVCCLAIAERNSKAAFKLINVKDKGGLLRVSEDVKKVCEVTEVCLQRVIKCCHGLAPFSPNILLAVTTTVLEIIAEKYS
jgi:hypothetical protein